MPFRDAVILATLTSAFPWIMFLCRHMAFIQAFIAGMRLRCAYSGLVFRKVIEEQEVTFETYLSKIVDYEIIHTVIGNPFQW